MANGVAVFGLGKVGMTLAACLARSGHRVIGVDVNSSVVDALNKRAIHTTEQGVMERIADVPRDQLTATADPAAAIKQTGVSFVIVPTPSNTLGGFSNQYALKACVEIGAALRDTKHAHTVAMVSTVLPGTSEARFIPALEKASGRKIGEGLGYCYNPAFIALGEVVKGFEEPDYLLVGESDTHAGDVVVDIHNKMIRNNAPLARMTPVEAEITKIASNTHETMRVSFANMLLSICAEVPGANVDKVTGALVHRMGRRFFKGAVPYGGPCWPRDNQALSVFMDMIGAPSQLPRTVDTSNAEHGRYVLRKILNVAPPRSKVGIIGLAYKPGTPVIERSYSIDLAAWLRAEGRTVLAWDPQAIDESRKALGDGVTFCADAESCLAQSDIVVIALPLPQIASIDWSAAKKATVVDCWRTMSPAAQQIVGRYVPLGIGKLEDKVSWIDRVGGERFDLLTN
jgi:UDPglucose 6-dehydrogenase